MPSTSPYAEFAEILGIPQKKEKSGKESQSALLVKMCSDVFLFHDRNDNIYGEIRADDGHTEVWPVRSRGFRRWLSGRFFVEQGKPPSSHATADALLAIEAEGQHKGPELEVYTRIARFGNDVYLNLCNRHWESVQITSDGWNVVSASPVKFIRTKGMLELPRPSADGRIEAINKLLNAQSPADYILMAAWLVQAMNPAGPYPVLVLEGPQGSAKTFTTRVLRNIVDPSTATVRATPREERDLVIAATNGWICAFDNISSLPNWLSDGLCRLSTGTGFSTRTLHTDAEEMIFAASRPVILNGISQVVTRHDLMDRAIFVNLEPISEERRREEKELLREFEETRPLVLGGLCDAVSAALRNEGKVRFHRLPRMADFARWVVSAEEALSCGSGEFMASYTRNRELAVDLTLDADIVGSTILKLMEDRTEWAGTPTELLEQLGLLVKENVARSQEWPKTATGLSKRIHRARTSLFQKGIKAEQGRTGKERLWRFTRLEKEKPVTSVTTVINTKNQEPGCDTSGDACESGPGKVSHHTQSDLLRNDTCDACDAFSPSLSVDVPDDKSGNEEAPDNEIPVYEV